MDKMNPWAGLYAPAGKPDLRDQLTKPKARQQRTACQTAPSGLQGWAWNCGAWQRCKPPRCREALWHALESDLIKEQL